MKLSTWAGSGEWGVGNKELGFSICTKLFHKSNTSPIPDPTHPHRGKFLRDQGYAETIAAAGDYYLTEDSTFVLVTSYERAAAEEKIWFLKQYWLKYGGFRSRFDKQV